MSVRPTIKRILNIHSLQYIYIYTRVFNVFLESTDLPHFGFYFQSKFFNLLFFKLCRAT